MTSCLLTHWDVIAVHLWLVRLLQSEMLQSVLYLSDKLYIREIFSSTTHTHLTFFLVSIPPVVHEAHLSSHSLYSLVGLAFSFDVPQIMGSCTWNIHEQPQAAIWLTRITKSFFFFPIQFSLKFWKCTSASYLNGRILIKVSSLCGNDLGSDFMKSVACGRYREVRGSVRGAGDLSVRHCTLKCGP